MTVPIFNPRQTNDQGYMWHDELERAKAAQPASMRPENGEDLAVAARDYQEAKAHLAHSQRILAREVANSVDAGMSVAEAARIAGVQRHTIYSWCWEAGKR